MWEAVGVSPALWDGPTHSPGLLPLPGATSVLGLSRDLGNPSPPAWDPPFDDTLLSQSQSPAPWASKVFLFPLC